MKTTLTDQDGNYSLPFYIYAQRYEPLRWKIETYRDGIGRASLVGQRIAMAQEDVFVLDHALALAHASSGTDPSAMMREDRDLGPQ